MNALSLAPMVITQLRFTMTTYIRRNGGMVFWRYMGGWITAHWSTTEARLPSHWLKGSGND
jgi:hypothetical protein